MPANPLKAVRCVACSMTAGPAARIAKNTEPRTDILLSTYKSNPNIEATKRIQRLVHNGVINNIWVREGGRYRFDEKSSTFSRSDKRD